MRQARDGLTGVVILLVAAIALSGCGQADVAALRRNYTAELNGWVAKQEPIAVFSDVATVEGGSEEGTGEPSEATEEAEPAPSGETEMVVQAQTVILDILVRHSGAGKLPGVTLDIWQADADHKDKQNWKVWIDTSDLALGKQLTHTLDGVNLEAGDVFSVEIKQHVPEADRSQYKEFSQQP